MILRDLEGQPRQPFQYRDKGTMATIGKRRAVAEIGKLTLTGRIAWLTWLAVHLYSLIGFRNRLSVLFNWFWNYVFSRREARLIVEKEWKLRD
jgi:NADH dehydrogenase